MKVLNSLVMLALGFSWASSLRADDKKPLDQLRGSWTVSKAEPATFEPKQFVFEGDTLTIVFGATEKKKAQIKIDATAKPAHIDIAEGKGFLPGIYEVKEDTLRICIADRPGAKRPSEFKSEKDGFLVSLKRDK